MPDWDAIRRYYRRHEKSILSAGRNGWGIDPYQWDFDGCIRMSRIEDMFWCDIRNEGVVMYPQYPVGRFFVDFANPCARVAIECDGKAFHQDVARDQRREEEIRALGWRVYRLSGSECMRDDVHAEDEHGRLKYTPAPGRVLLQQICSHTDIRVRGASGLDPLAKLMEHA